jgi:hypothetical protein
MRQIAFVLLLAGCTMGPVYPSHDLELTHPGIVFTDCDGSFPSVHVDGGCAVCGMAGLPCCGDLSCGDPSECATFVAEPICHL